MRFQRICHVPVPLQDVVIENNPYAGEIKNTGNDQGIEDIVPSIRPRLG